MTTTTTTTTSTVPLRAEIELNVFEYINGVLDGDGVLDRRPLIDTTAPVDDGVRV